MRNTHKHQKGKVLPLRPRNKSKRFAALARVSSREQEREGFSLEVQEEALERYATSENGTYAKKSTDLRDQAGMLALQIEGCDRSKKEMGQTALRMFELSQNLKEQWLKADVMEKRQILQMVGSDYVLNGVTLCYSIEKPFDVLAEGTFLKNGRGDRI